MRANLKTLQVAISYAGSDAGQAARVSIEFALRELEQLRSLHGPFQVTHDEFSRAWHGDPHDRQSQADTLESLNLVLAKRAPSEQAVES